MYRERGVFHQFHFEIADAFVLFTSVESSDVRMVQRREDSGFTLEPGQAFKIIGEEVRKDFEGHIPAKFRIVGAVDLPRPAQRESRAGGGNRTLTGGKAHGIWSSDPQPLQNLKSRVNFTASTRSCRAGNPGWRVSRLSVYTTKRSLPGVYSQRKRALTLTA